MKIDYDDISKYDIRECLQEKGIITLEQVKDGSVEIDDELYEDLVGYVEDWIRDELQYKVSNMMWDSMKSYFEETKVLLSTSIKLEDK